MYMNEKLTSLFFLQFLAPLLNDSILHLDGVLKLDELLSAPENPLRNSVRRNPDALVWSGGKICAFVMNVQILRRRQRIQTLRISLILPNPGQQKLL